MSDSATAMPAKGTHTSVLLAVFSSASALHRTAATRKISHCCVYSLDGPVPGREAALHASSLPARHPQAMAAEPTTDRTEGQTKPFRCVVVPRCRRVHRELSRSPRALFPMQAECETLANCRQRGEADGSRLSGGRGACSGPFTG